MENLKGFKHQRFVGQSKTMVGGPTEPRKATTRSEEPTGLKETIDENEDFGGTGEGLFSNFTRSDFEEQLPQIRVRREVVDPTYFRGLNLRWVNVSTVEISTGEWGHPTGIFEVKDALASIIDTTTVKLWWFVFVAVADNDPTKFKAFSSKSLGGGNPPAGFNRFRRIGAVYVDSNNEVAQFTQDGAYAEKRYYIKGILLYNQIDTVITEITLPDLPDGINTYTMLAGINANGNGDIVYRAFPSIAGAPAPSIANVGIAITGARSQFLGEQFNIVLTRNKMWHALNPIAYTGFELYMQGYVDNV